MRTPALAEFTDGVAARSAKHLREIATNVAVDHRAALRQAFRAGVEVLCYDCIVDPVEVTLAERWPWVGAKRFGVEL